MKLFTIGFTQKRAQTFFGLLRAHEVRCLVDIRLNPGGQLSGFAKQEDLPYFLRELANGCAYRHLPELAPTKDILGAYRQSGDWQEYERSFEALMGSRGIPQSLDTTLFQRQTCCLLCSEPTPDQCHRRLVAERLSRFLPDIEIIHL